MGFQRTSRILCRVQLAGDLGEDRLGHMEGNKTADKAENLLNERPTMNGL